MKLLKKPIESDLNSPRIIEIQPKHEGMSTEYNEYDKHVDFFLTNLINSIVLFSMNREELQELEEPWFDPLFELESEIDYAFTPVCFESIFRNNLIDWKFRQKLLDFKIKTDEIPATIWKWEFIDSNHEWIAIRKEANEILVQLRVEDRGYNDDYTTIHTTDGELIKKGRKV